MEKCVLLYHDISRNRYHTNFILFFIIPPKLYFIISLNNPIFVLIIIYIIFLILAFVTVYMRRFYSAEIELSYDEILFLRFFELYKNANLTLKTKNRIMKDKYKSNLIKEFKKIVLLVEGYDYGNISLNKNILSDEIETFKLNVRKYLYNNVILGDNSDLASVRNFLLDICKYLLNPRLNSLIWLNNQIQSRLIIKEIEKKSINGTIYFNVYKRPLLFRIIFLTIIIISIVVIGIKLEVGISVIFMASITSIWGSLSLFNVIFKEENRNKYIPEKKEEEIATKPSVIIEKPVVMQNVLFKEDFEDYSINIIPPLPWEITMQGNGKIIVTDEIGGALGTNKCIKIDHPMNSMAYIKRNFEQQQHVRIEYFIYIDKYEPDGLGSPFIVESSIDVGRPYGIRVVYMEINNCYLAHKIPKTESIYLIESRKWYKIQLEIDCKKHTYTYKINDDDPASFKFPNEFTSVNAIRTKFFPNNRIWKTYIDEVKVIKMD